MSASCLTPWPMSLSMRPIRSGRKLPWLRWLAIGGKVLSIKGDALIASLRAKMRRDYGFTRETGKSFGIRAVYSKENLGHGSRAALASGAEEGASPGAPLACSGYGSLVTVTAAFGLAAASLSMKMILGKKR
jgi:tRNA A37 threonylcarbamoyladenosine dehydratase